MDTYKCFAVNKYGRAFCSAKLTVAGGKRFSSSDYTSFPFKWFFSPVEMNTLVILLLVLTSPVDFRKVLRKR